MSLERPIHRSARAASLLAAALLLPATALAADTAIESKPGYVDKEIFTRLAGDEDVRVEIWLPRSLIVLFGALDEELAEAVEGLDLLQAVVLELEGADAAARARKVVRETESMLKRKGWVRLALVRDEESEVYVLVRTQDEKIEGLTVLVVDESDGSLVFANVVGTIDLAKIRALGEELDIPGLADIEVD